MHLMSGVAVPMTTTVVAGMVAAGCNDARRTTGGVNGNGEGISGVSVRMATLSDACSVTSTINDAYRHSTSLFAVEGSTRVTPDGTRGERAVVLQKCFFDTEGIADQVRRPVVAWIQINHLFVSRDLKPRVMYHGIPGTVRRRLLAG